MIESVDIRFVTIADMQELVQLCELHSHFEQSDYDPAGKEEALSNHLFSSPPSLYCLVAEHEGRIVGYASYMKQFSTWDASHYLYMDCLYLVDEARGFGIGEKMMHRIAEEGRKLGCKLIQWQTPDFNKRAIKFYNRIGAVPKPKERYFWDI